MSDNREHIAINAMGFIVPNRSYTVEEFCATNKLTGTYDYLLDLAELNGIELSKDDKVVQMWFHNKKELMSDNLVDHGFDIRLSSGRLTGVASKNLQWVPEKLLEGITEGSIVSIKAPAKTIYNIRLKSQIDIVLDMSVTCKQLPFRYSRFGTFEQALKLVCE